MNNSIEYNLFSNSIKNIDYYRRKIEKIVRKQLSWRYEMPTCFHDVKVINDIIYNEKTHFVEEFKEYLLYEDNNEFLNRYYKTIEICNKLPRILNFYEQCSKIYPNYTVIPESKYMYKNIKKKQKVIDQMQFHIRDFENEEEEDGENLSSHIFNTNVINSINSFTMSLYTNYSSFNENNSKSDIDTQDLIKIINYYDNQNKNKNINNNKINSNNNSNNSNFIVLKKKSENFFKKKLLSERNIIRGISALFNSNTRMRLIEKKKNLNLMISKRTNSISNNDTKTDKFILSTNASTSSKFSNKKIFTKKKIIHKKNIFLSPNISLNKKNSNSKNKIHSTSQRNKNNPSKIFSNNLIYYIKVNSNNLENKKSKTISKTKNKNKKQDRFIYSNNNINTIKRGISYLNIYTGNELLNSFNMKVNFILNTKNLKKNKSPKYNNFINTNKFNNNVNNTVINKNILNNNYNKNENNSQKKKIPNLNIRKIIYKKTTESLSDRNNISKNLHQIIGKKFNNHKNSISNRDLTNSKNSINEISQKLNHKHPYCIIHKNLNKEISSNDINTIKISNQNREINSSDNINNIKRIDSNLNIGNKFSLRNLSKFITKNTKNNIDKNKK